MLQAPNNRPTTRTGKQLLTIMFIYIILTFSNRLSTKTNESDQIMIVKIQGKTNIQMATLFNEISKEKLEGLWIMDSQTNAGQGGQGAFRQNIGKFQILIGRYSDQSGEKVSLDVRMKNGEYADDGVIQFRVLDLPANWQIQPQTNKITARLFQPQKASTPLKIPYTQTKIFHITQHNTLTLTNIQLLYQIHEKSLKKSLILHTPTISITYTLQHQQYNMSGTILFALILFIIAYSQFTACMDIIRKFIQGDDVPANYSFFTLLFAMMWDSALSLTAFVEAFRNQENIVLFIVPAFILSLLFTNLELRIMVAVFQAGVTDLRQAMCKFNLLTYGSMMAMYPLMIYTNMDTPFFIFFSLIFLPQIYTNAITGKRPNPHSYYYNEFLLFRYLIVLYLKCFPYNIFELRPNYLLGFGCLFLVACQFGLLWIQKVYGPKKVFPKFMLPRVYSYECREEMEEGERGRRETVETAETAETAETGETGGSGESVEVEGGECSICLEGLRKNIQIPENQGGIYLGISKLMKTPCGHKYHGYCLIRWMTMKMQCPQCRSKLPPYQ